MRQSAARQGSEGEARQGGTGWNKAAWAGRGGSFKVGGGPSPLPTPSSTGELHNTHYANYAVVTGVVWCGTVWCDEAGIVSWGVV